MKTQNWYSKNDTYGHSKIACEDTGRTVAVAYDEKDGALLASAPELLAALKGMMQEFGGGYGALDPEISADISRIAALAAIAKAEGGAL